MDKYEDMLEDIYPDIHKDKLGIKKDMNVYQIINLIAPGNPIRIALDEILKAEMGALIVLGTNIVLDSIIRGGIKLDNEMYPSTLFELAKMDGAIILSNDLKKIIYANVHLTPDRNIESKETGIRHRSGEQTAKQTGLPVVAISKRRNIISVYYQKEHFVLHDLPYLTTKADHYLKMISNYRMQINGLMNELTYYEINNNSTYNDAIKVIQKMMYLEKAKIELERIIIELGEEGNQIKQALHENTSGLRIELHLILMDYSQSKDKPEMIVEKLYPDSKEIFDRVAIANVLGIAEDKIDEPVEIKGHRLLSKIPKINRSTLEKVTTSYDSLSNIFSSNKEDLITKAGLSDKQAELLKEQLNKIYDTVMNKIYKM
jgi:diadenylate cyclase